MAVAKFAHPEREQAVLQDTNQSSKLSLTQTLRKWIPENFFSMIMSSFEFFSMIFVALLKWTSHLKLWEHVHHSLTSALCETVYLSRIITSHSAHACDGMPLRLHCPRHSTISIQSAFYGSSEVQLCRADPPPRPHNHSCSAFTALQVRFMYGIYSTLQPHWVCR